MCLGTSMVSVLSPIVSLTVVAPVPGLSVDNGLGFGVSEPCPPHKCILFFIVAVPFVERLLDFCYLIVPLTKADDLSPCPR